MAPAAAAATRRAGQNGPPYNAFVYVGGKARVAAEVWRRFGDVDCYFEPFAGGAGVLRHRPEPFAGAEYANDLDGMIANVWRALRAGPAGLEEMLQSPPLEVDLHARNRWLIARRQTLVEALRADIDYFDPQAAVWYLWCAGWWFGAGLAAATLAATLPEVLVWFRHRLRRVVIDCGDWRRSVCRARWCSRRTVGVFLDPPYHARSGRTPRIYACEDLAAADDVREWAVAHGGDPRFRIALCGLEGEHKLPRGWHAFRWKNTGGFCSKPGSRSSQNRDRERVYFSPHCLR